MDKLVGAVHKSADIQAKLPVKLQWGNKTRPWRGLMNRFESLVKSYEVLNDVISDKPYKKYYDSINFDDLKIVSDYLEKFVEIFNDFESSKSPSAQFVILSLKFFIKIIIKRSFTITMN